MMSNGKPKDQGHSNVPAVKEKENLPAVVEIDVADAGAGMEDVSPDELRIPFLYSLKSNSPQVAAPPGQGGVPGARPGMIMNMGTGELFDGTKGIQFIPVMRDHNYVEFTPRNLGGGFVAIYPPDDERIIKMRESQGKFGKLFTGTKRDEKGAPLDGTEISETFYLYGIMVHEDGRTDRVIVPFTSTQIKKYQAFMNRQTGLRYDHPQWTLENPKPKVQPPIWAHRWRLGTTYEKNKKGEFYGWTLSLWSRNQDGSEAPYTKSFLPAGSDLYKEAKAFHEMLKSGKARADYTSSDTVVDDVTDDENPPM